MLAIVGAKGGCGKTTITLGRATALARAGERAVAVDADRQLPTLHAVAGVDREPTVLDVADPGDVPANAQPTSQSAEAAIVVTTPTDQCLEAASRTAALADRLDVPVAGTVVTRADEAPLAAAERVGAPVIGSIPEASSTLAATPVRAAVDDAVTRRGQRTLHWTEQ